jgi:phosphatidylglycerol:prolipoprotein diacylglycerol transferase
VPIVATLAAATPALAIGHAIGRIGCFLVGDDYGRPSDLPWAVRVPAGSAANRRAGASHAALSKRSRCDRSRGCSFDGVGGTCRMRSSLGRYLVLAGSIRFAIEFIRVNVRIVGPLTLAHLVSLALVLIGSAVLVFSWREGPSTGLLPLKRRHLRAEEWARRARLGGCERRVVD